MCAVLVEIACHHRGLEGPKLAVTERLQCSVRRVTQLCARFSPQMPEQLRLISAPLVATTNSS